MLFDVLDACPTTKVWKTPHRAPEPNLAGLRDRVLLLVGFVGGLRRSELAGIDVEDLVDHPRGLVLTIPRSKTNQYGSTADLVVLPLAGRAERCPVRAIRAWRDAAGITDGPLLRPVGLSAGGAFEGLRRCQSSRNSSQAHRRTPHELVTVGRSRFRRRSRWCPFPRRSGRQR